MSFNYVTKFRRGPRGRQYPPLAERFWVNVQKSLDGCWEWLGAKNWQGRGAVSTTRYSKQVILSAPRVSFEMHHFPPPPDRVVCHRCDNPGCVRPSHLFLGTQADNMADAKKKGRMSRGERRYNAKLTDAHVRSIRAMHAVGIIYREIARVLGVHKMSVYQVVNGRAWAHVS